MARRRIAAALEALPWLAAAGYLAYLAAHVLPRVSAYRHACGLRSALPWGGGCSTQNFEWCSPLALLLLTALFILVAVRTMRAPPLAG
jgi:hypothetical protein